MAPASSTHLRRDMPRCRLPLNIRALLRPPHPCTVMRHTRAAIDFVWLKTHTLSPSVERHHRSVHFCALSPSVERHHRSVHFCALLPSVERHRRSAHFCARHTCRSARNVSSTTDTVSGPPPSPCLGHHRHHVWATTVTMFGPATPLRATPLDARPFRALLQGAANPSPTICSTHFCNFTTC